MVQAMTTEELLVKRETLITRIADAVKRTQFGDRSVEYATVEEMERALAILDGQIAAASSTPTKRCLLIQHSNG